MSASTEILLIAIVTATACALPGVFLVLRQMAMMSDAISHTVLLGIVLGFFAFRDFNPLSSLAFSTQNYLTLPSLNTYRKGASIY